MNTLDNNKQFLLDNTPKWQAGADLRGYYKDSQTAHFFEKTLTGDLYHLNGFLAESEPDFILTREEYEAAQAKNTNDTEDLDMLPAINTTKLIMSNSELTTAGNIKVKVNYTVEQVVADGNEEGVKGYDADVSIITGFFYQVKGSINGKSFKRIFDHKIMVSAFIKQLKDADSEFMNMMLAK